MDTFAGIRPGDLPGRAAAWRRHRRCSANRLLKGALRRRHLMIGQVLRRFLFGVGPSDLLTLAAVCLIGGMIWRMRVKTSVTIDERVLRGIDKATTRTRSRSRVIEDAAREFLARRARAARESRDLEILNRSADALNREMEDVLAYQADV